LTANGIMLIPGTHFVLIPVYYFCSHGVVVYGTVFVNSLIIATW